MSELIAVYFKFSDIGYSFLVSITIKSLITIVIQIYKIISTFFETEI